MPNSGPAAGGIVVMIIGLKLTNVTTVKFGTAPATTVVSDDSITAVAPVDTTGAV